MELNDLQKVDKRIARRLWDNGCSLAFVSNNDRSTIEHMSNRDHTEVRDFDRFFNGVSFYRTSPVYCYAKPEDIDDLRSLSREEEKIRNDARAKMEAGQQVLIGNFNGSYYDALLKHENNTFTEHEAHIHGNVLMLSYEYEFNNKKHIDYSRVDNILSVRWETLNRDTVYSLRTPYSPQRDSFTEDGEVKRVKIVNLMHNKFMDYDSGVVYEDYRFVQNLQHKVPEWQLHTSEKDGVVIYDDGNTRQMFNRKALNEQIQDFRDEGRITEGVARNLRASVRGAEHTFNRNGVDAALDMFKDDVDDNAPHLRDEWFPKIDKAITSLPESKLEVQFDNMFDALNVKANTQMRFEMREILYKAMYKNMSTTSLSKALQKGINELRNNGEEMMPGGMVYAKDIEAFFMKHHKELAQLDMTQYPNKRDPYFMDIVNREWAVRKGFESFLNELETAAKGKEKILDNLPTKRMKKSEWEKALDLLYQDFDVERPKTKGKTR